MTFTSPDESLDSVDNLLRVKGAVETREAIPRLRELRQTEDNRTLFPDEGSSLPKVRWAAMSAAGSYPRCVSVDEIVSRSGLMSQEISAYCTSKNNPTPKYLYKVDGTVLVRPEGIDWWINLPRKDRQIEEDAGSNEENAVGGS